MDLQITYKSNPLLLSFTPISHTSPRPLLFNLPTKHRPKISRQRPVFRVMASASSNGSDGFSWLSLSRSIRRGSERFWFDFGEWVKETGFDLKEVNVIVGEYLELVGDRLKKGGIELERFRTELLPEFVSWNQWERWKLVFRTVGFSGADIPNLVNEAAIMSVRKGRSKIYQKDIVDVLDKQLLEGMGVLLTEEEQRKCEQSVSSEKKKLLAVHGAVRWAVGQ